MGLYREAHWLTKTFVTLGRALSNHDLFVSCGATQRHLGYPAPQTDQAAGMFVRVEARPYTVNVLQVKSNVRLNPVLPTVG